MAQEHAKVSAQGDGCKQGLRRQYEGRSASWRVAEETARSQAPRSLNMFSIFRKKPSPIPLEQQLKALADCGIRLSPEATVDDLFMFHPREEHEATPFKELIPTLGFEMERDSFAPICHRLWMCDYERVEDNGSYVDVIARLNQMSEQSLPISNIKDHVDLEAVEAWVEFDLAGSRVHWDAKVDNDWLDPYI